MFPVSEKVNVFNLIRKVKLYAKVAINEFCLSGNFYYSILL